MRPLTEMRVAAAAAGAAAEAMTEEGREERGKERMSGTDVGFVDAAARLPGLAAVATADGA